MAAGDDRDRSRAARGPQRGVAAVEVAATILDALRTAPAPLGVTAIAHASGLAPSRVHHYLVSLLRTGLVRKDETRYSLGPFAIRMGLTAVDRLDIQHFSAPFLHDLSARTEEASFFSIWSSQGPVIVRWQQGSRPLTVYARLGVAMPLIRSATGQVFTAWGPPSPVADIVAAELRRYPPDQRRTERKAVQRRTEEARRHGCGITRGGMLPEVSAVAAPVFDHKARLAGALTVLGLRRSFDAAPDGAAARAVRTVARQLSAKLGHKMSLIYDR
ncbi:IclR family transcriptional regulator [Reyranella sp. CPCC 100927]|uniref:IclR family transcriptional regulator n=1 Tax=Reyranella sp. CPCC 100927 TaxID=2599616 RepID=UPI0011B85ED9|nr:IclR family transcriptional regulator [Reyranella sp. CPCC 100927]TWT13895.1 IclR family transcriptional regulator [Reyranella sp. CPCC 100927]